MHNSFQWLNPDGSNTPCTIVFRPDTGVLRFPDTGGASILAQDGGLGNRMTLAARIMSRGFFAKNVGPGHQINMLRADLDAISVGHPKCGHYRGHGGILGDIESNEQAAAMLESWDPTPGPGCHHIPLESVSRRIPDNVWFDMEITSLHSAVGKRYYSMELTQPGCFPLIQTGDVLDDNGAIDMFSQVLGLACIFAPMDPSDPGEFIMNRPAVSWAKDTTPRANTCGLSWGRT